MMRAMIIAAAAALAGATSAAAAEPAACYDVALVGHLRDYANEQNLDPIPVPSEGLFLRVKADALIQTRKVVKGPDVPPQFWARAVMTEVPYYPTPLLIYLKNQADGVPVMIGYRYLHPWYPRPATDYPAC